MPETILVTGGAGFIGSHLVKELVKSGYSVRVLDNLSNGSLENIRDVLGSIEFIKGDIRDKNVVEDALKGVDAVVHLAALIDVAESVEKPELYLDVNVNGTFNVARASRKVSAFIFASTCAVYGEPVKIPIGEDHPLRPKSPYAATKIAGEAFVQAYGNLYGYRPVILRLFNVYGPRQSKAYAGVITEFVKRATSGEPPIIFGDGEQTRDFVHVKDVAKAIIKALDSDNASGIYNVGSGVAVTINDLAHLILKLAGKENVEPIHGPPRPGDIKHSQANINRAKKELGYNPSVSLEKGIREILSLGKK
ncbi:MAG: SDR family NAD(P)-dependent oxidoreductase [Thermofilum sp.]|nr:SDR family NAD(P)-dependent oxidoreductase [Thermofilum sp.]